MIKCVIKDINKDEKIRFSGECIDVSYDELYKEGDFFTVSTDTDFVSVSFDESQKQSIIYVPEHEFTYTVPLGKAITAYDGESWSKKGHKIIERVYGLC